MTLKVERMAVGEAGTVVLIGATGAGDGAAAFGASGLSGAGAAICGSGLAKTPAGEPALAAASSSMQLISTYQLQYLPQVVVEKVQLVI